MVCPKFPVDTLITLTELFAVDDNRGLEETEDFKERGTGSSSMTNIWPKLPLQEGWLNVNLRFFPVDGLKPAGMETEVGAWPKRWRLDVAVVPATDQKADDDEAVDFGTRNA